jgi:hypothetical protein
LGDEKNADKFWNWRTERRTFRIPKHRWEDNIKILKAYLNEKYWQNFDSIGFGMV